MDGAPRISAPGQCGTYQKVPEGCVTGGLRRHQQAKKAHIKWPSQPVIDLLGLPKNHGPQTPTSGSGPESGREDPVKQGHLGPTEIQFSGKGLKQNVFNGDQGKCGKWH